MYSGPWSSLQNAIFLDWPPYRGEKSISALAQRVVSEQRIQPGSILIGSSLGGFVACEIANEIELGGLILIGSARQREEISALFSAFSSLTDQSPLGFIQLIARKLPNKIIQMFGAAEPEFIRAMSRAIFKWDGLNREDITPIRIHGKNDHVIPLPPGVQHILDGGHLLAITHAAQCVEIVKSAIKNNCSS